MSFALDDMKRGPLPVARVVVAATKGSVPREVGASMQVSADAVSGTIGGGALEFEAIERAKQALQAGADRVDHLPLGPGLGQCCGGAVTLLTEVWDAERLAGVTADVVVRPLPGETGPPPMAVSRLLAVQRGQGQAPRPGIVAGWMVEPISVPEREIWVWGAGHVGRAIVGGLAPLPGMVVYWADVDQSRFPTDIPEGVKTLVAANPADLVTVSGENSEHLVLTFSHALDLEICHRVLGRPFRSLGLIGSVTKRNRFRKRLAELGHGPAQIDRMQCPIGDPGLGKHPHAIALGVAAELVRRGTMGVSGMEQSA